jgi:hypothetical protein
MAEDKRVTRRGVRQMMRPKPRRVTGRDPFKPPPLPTRHTDAFLLRDEGPVPLDYATLERRILERHRWKEAMFPYVYGGGAEMLASYVTQANLYMGLPPRREVD